MAMDRRRFLRQATVLGASALALTGLAACSAPASGGQFAPAGALRSPSARQGGRLDGPDVLHLPHNQLPFVIPV